MADVRRYIEIVFSAIDDSGPAIKSLGDNLKTVSQNVGLVTGPMAATVDAVVRFDLAMAAAASTIIAFSINAAGDFDASFREISTLFDAGAEDVQSFKASVLDAAGASSGSFDSFTGSIYDAISAGVDFKDSIEFVTDAEKLAVGGRADLNRTTELLVSTLNAYGASTDQASRFSDVLFQTVRLGITDIPRLSEAIGKVTPTAAAAGVSFEELNAGVAILTRNGIATSEAVTGLKAAFSNIIKPTSEAQEAAKALGLDFSVTALQSKGLGGFMQELADKTGGNIEVMGRLFGSTEALNSVMVLTKGGASGLKEAITLMGESAGSTDAAYKEMADSLPVQTNIMLNALRAAAVAIGDTLLQPFIAMERGATAVFLAIKNSAQSGAFRPLQDLVRDVFGEIETFLQTLAANLPAALEEVDFTGLTEAIRRLGEALGATFDGIDISKPEGLADVIQLIVDAITAVVDTTTGIAQFFSALIAGITRILPGTTGLSSEMFILAGQILAVGKGVNILLPGMEGLGNVAVTVGKKIIENGGISSSLSKLAGVAGTLITGPVGLTILGGTMLYAADQALNGGRATDFLTNALSKGVGAVSDFVGGTKEIGPTSSAAAFALGALVGAAQDTAVAQATATDTTVAVSEVQRALFPFIYENGQAWRTQATETINWVQASDSLTAAIDRTRTRVEQYADALGLTNNNTELASKGFTKIEGVITNVTPLFGELHDQAAPAMDDVSEKTEAAAESAEKFELEWEKLRAQEREVIFKASADIAVAQIEAQAAQVVAAFDSISVTVQSTGELIGALANAFINAQTESDQSQILRLLEEEQKNRAKALELQKQLTEAQIKVLNAQASRLESGDAFITISADGLEPELEAFMFKILARIQTKASADAQQFLLGL